MTDAVRAMEVIGRAGHMISICCGPCGTDPFRWTVLVRSRDGEEFARPYAAESFDHAVSIAQTEIVRRGWNSFPPTPITEGPS